MTAKWGTPGERQPAVLESMHPALTVALLVVLVILASALSAGLGGAVAG